MNLDAVGFKYKIGDLLVHKGLLPLSTEEKGYRMMERVIYVVVGRIAEECPGGVQLHYAVSACKNPFGAVVSGIRLHEIEVLPFAGKAPDA